MVWYLVKHMETLYLTLYFKSGLSNPPKTPAQ